MQIGVERNRRGRKPKACDPCHGIIVDAIVAFRTEGMPMANLAGMFRVTPRTVRRWLRAANPRAETPP